MVPMKFAAMVWAVPLMDCSIRYPRAPVAAVQVTLTCVAETEVAVTFVGAAGTTTMVAGAEGWDCSGATGAPITRYS